MTSLRHTLADALLEARDASDDVDRDALEALLVELLKAARSRYPGVRLDAEHFARHLGSRIAGGQAVFDALGHLRAEDLYLARACVSGDRNAIASFESECMRGADGALRRRSIDEDTVEEAKQNIRERLLVGGGSPRLVEYDGKGDLRQWVRITVLREAIYLSKRSKRHEPMTYDLLTLPHGSDDPEVAYFKKRYRAEYKEAFEAALSALSARERSLLRQQFILGLTVDEIGTIYDVHRATAARWVKAARDDLIARARRELAARVGLSDAEIETIVKMIDSQLDASLRRVLAGGVSASSA